MSAYGTELEERMGDEGQRASFRDVKKDVSNLKRDTMDAISGNIEAGIDATRGKYEEMCDFVRKNPAMSIALAVGLGALGSRLFKR